MKKPGEKLGISIRGGAKSHPGNPFDKSDEGIFISKVTIQFYFCIKALEQTMPLSNVEALFLFSSHFIYILTFLFKVVHSVMCILFYKDPF